MRTVYMPLSIVTNPLCDPCFHNAALPCHSDVDAYVDVHVHPCVCMCVVGAVFKLQHYHNFPSSTSPPWLPLHPYPFLLVFLPNRNSSSSLSPRVPSYSGAKASLLTDNGEAGQSRGLYLEPERSNWPGTQPTEGEKRKTKRKHVPKNSRLKLHFHMACDESLPWPGILNNDIHILHVLSFLATMKRKPLNQLARPA